MNICIFLDEKKMHFRRCIYTPSDHFTDGHSLLNNYRKNLINITTKL